jgi:hypothetical protein
MRLPTGLAVTFSVYVNARISLLPLPSALLVVAVASDPT